MSETLDRVRDFKILIATDNHLGYAENHPDRGPDSFRTFEEILEIGKEQNVDFVLLGGDLFHENKPSKRTMVDCMNALARHCRGDAPIYMKLVSDPSENFKGALNPIPNWEDPNINVSLPVFSIHGNHDDPSGVGGYCALDELSTAGLVNYIGRTTDFNKGITLSPVLLKKDGTTVAIYGLSAMKDDRVYRLFFDKKVAIVRHTEPTFNILVVHQNREKHAEARYLPESFLDFRDSDGQGGDRPFFHLVIWGHEHECKQAVEKSVGDAYFLLQPGSSVATSLCPGESVEKRVFTMTVSGLKFHVKHHTLKTVRPMIHRAVNLRSLDSSGSDEQVGREVENFLEKVVYEAVDEAKTKLSGDPRQPQLPLVRVNVEYDNDKHLFNTVRFGQRFAELIANPESLILMKKASKRSRLTKEELDGETAARYHDGVAFRDRGPESIEQLVGELFSEAAEDDCLTHLAPELLSAAVTTYVQKEDDDALANYIRKEMDRAMKFVETVQVSDDVGEEKVDELLAQYRAVRKLEVDAEVERFTKEGVIPSSDDGDAQRRRGDQQQSSSRGGRASNGDNDNDGPDDADEGDEDEDDGDLAPVRLNVTSGRGRRGGRAAAASPRVRGARGGRGRGRGRRRATDNADEDVDVDGSPTRATSTRARGRARRGANAANTTATSTRSRQATLDATVGRGSRR